MPITSPAESSSLDQAFQLLIVFAANGAGERADYAGCQSSVQSERVADGEHLLPYL
jgi:hypothetical protein